MAYWLVKSEPSTYSWEKLVKDKHTTWDGVRNYAARIHLKAMKKGDQVLFYHSNEGLEIVGIAKVARKITRILPPMMMHGWPWIWNLIKN